MGSAYAPGFGDELMEMCEEVLHYELETSVCRDMIEDVS